MHRDQPPTPYPPPHSRSSDYSNHDYQSAPYPHYDDHEAYPPEDPDYPPPNTQRALDRHRPTHSSRSRSRRYYNDDPYDSYTSSSSDDDRRHRRRSSRKPSRSSRNRSRSRSRSKSPLKKAVAVAKSHTSTSHTGIGAGLVGAVAGGFLAQKASQKRFEGQQEGWEELSRRERKALREREQKESIGMTIAGAVLGGLGGNALGRLQDDKEHKHREMAEDWRKKNAK